MRSTNHEEGLRPEPVRRGGLAASAGRVRPGTLLLGFSVLLAAFPASAVRYIDPVAYVRLRPDGHTATVQALAFSPDSQTLYSAGADKAVRSWRATGRPGAAWSPGETLRWEVGRGDAGVVYGLAVAPESGLVAVAGRGFRGKIGDLVWFDPQQPKRYQAWRFPEDAGPGVDLLQHEQVVRSLAFSPDGAWFASADLDGHVLLWGGPGRQPGGELLPPLRRVNRRDDDVWRPTGYAPRWRPLAWAGPRTLVYPRITPGDVKTMGGSAVPVWRLSAHDPVTGRSRELGKDEPSRFPGFVMAIAATPDGARIAAAGLDRVVLYERDANGDRYTARRITTGAPRGAFARGLAYPPDGERLRLGRQRADGSRGFAHLIELSVGEGATIGEWPTAAPVEACAVSRDGRWLALAAANDVLTIDRTSAPATPQQGQATRLPGGPRVERVAYLAGGDGPPRLLIQATDATRLVDAGEDELIRTLGTGEQPPATAAAPAFAGWSFDPATRIVRRLDRELARLPLEAGIHGGVRPDAWCWVPGADQQPRAIAVGASVSGAVLVYSLEATPNVLRHFVAHEGGVRSLACHPAGDQLASGADDGTTALWDLGPLWQQKPGSIAATWGVALRADGDAAAVESVAPGGPFFTRGVRPGDRLQLLTWRERGRRRSVAGRDAIAARLRAIAPADVPEKPYLEIEKAEGGEPIGLNFSPSWGPLLSVYGRGERWVAWTPTGQYASSLGGDRLIGWQFNGEPGEAPSFATAQQHHRRFRRPERVRELLGGVVAAEEEVVEEIVTTTIDNQTLPTVRVEASRVTEDGELKVAVTVDAPEGETIDEVALLDASGRKLAQVQGPFEAGDVVREITVEPIDGARRVLTARVYGSSGIADAAQTVPYQPNDAITKALRESGEDQRVLYLLAVGVADYDRSVGLGDLDYADDDAERVAGVFSDHPAYDRVATRVLTGKDRTTGARIRRELQRLLSGADGNDTVGLFYAGHSRDESGDVRLIPSDGDSDGLASGDLVRRFDAAKPSTVLILDSCHSGRFGDAVRRRATEIGDRDVDISLFAACSAEQQAREAEDLGMGLFTSYVVGGLRGDADRMGVGVVSDFDLYAYLFRDRTASERFAASRQRPIFFVPSVHGGGAVLDLTRVEESPER
ncbi:MAG: caspase family protein [Planctomycetota bacterium]